ncbi:MAG TPA: DUF6110 family protein [Anaerovoracaceae bacterium]|nr:DUF6110 family protein [Anaerovoracaceae bacterium]
MPNKNEWAIFGLGVLAGTVGWKILKSESAKQVYVKLVTTGLQAKAGYDKVIENAKANVDDIVAEAKYRNDCQTEQGVDESCPS